MSLNNISSSNNIENIDQKIFETPLDVEKQNTNINKLQEEANMQKSKDKVQAEIMSYFIQNPEDNITFGMNISRDSKSGCEVIDFGNAKHEDKNLNKLFNGKAGVRLLADGTGEKGEEFSKELVIDRKTNKKGILFVGKKGFNIEQVDFEDITKYDVPYETYFVYRESGQAFVRLIKNDLARIKFRSNDGNIYAEMEFGMDILKDITPEKLQEIQEQLISTLKEAKNNGTLDITIDMLLSQMSQSEEIKKHLRNEFYRLAES